jgi:hypothetical protein
MQTEKSESAKGILIYVFCLVGAITRQHHMFTLFAINHAIVAVIGMTKSFYITRTRVSTILK